MPTASQRATRYKKNANEINDEEIVKEIETMANAHVNASVPAQTAADIEELLADLDLDDDEGDVAGPHLRLGGGVDAARERLDHRRLGEGDGLRQLEGEGFGVDDGRAQDAVDRRRRPEAHRRIDVIHAHPRRPAVGVGDARLHADPVAFLEARHLGADLDDRARGLVAEDHRRLDLEGSDLAVGIVVHIRAADADGVQLDAHVARAEMLFPLDREVPQRQCHLLFENEGFHVLIPFRESAGARGVGPAVSLSR